MNLANETSTERAEVEDTFTPPGTGGGSVGNEVVRRRVLRGLSFRNISAIYVFVVIFIVFSLLVPETFLVSGTWRSIVDDQAVTILVAVALTIPLAAGVFDLAVGAQLGFGSVLVAHMLKFDQQTILIAVLLTLLVGASFGALAGVLVVYAKIDSFIATLGISSILIALTAWRSQSLQIVGLGPDFQDLTVTSVGPLTYASIYVLLVATLVWYVLECTPLGRRIYAVGGSRSAARLSGVRPDLIIIGAFVACSIIAFFGGIIASSRLGTGDPTIGPAFLLPAFAGAALGSTQFRGGRYNVWGTVIAVFVLATGVKGLQLAGAPVWIPEFFNGAALLVAVGLAKWERSGARWDAVRAMFRSRTNESSHA